MDTHTSPSRPILPMMTAPGAKIFAVCSGELGRTARLARTRFGHDRHIPQPICRGRWGGNTSDRGRDANNTKDSLMDASFAHETKFPICVKPRCVRTKAKLMMKQIFVRRCACVRSNR